MSRLKIYWFHFSQIIMTLLQDTVALFRCISRQSAVVWVRKKLRVLHRHTTQKVHYYTTKKLHDRLYKRFSLYARHWEWRYRKHLHTTLATLTILIVAVSVSTNYQRAFASSSMPVTGFVTVLNSNEKVYFGGDFGSSVSIDNYSRQMDGHGWSQDIGWLSFGTESNPDGPVTADANGVLSGKAKVQNAGTVDFDDYGAHVTVTNGHFSGYAWSNDLGWLDFSHLESAGYDPDLSLPVNASNIVMQKTDGGANVANNGWNNTNGFFAWSPATDNGGGSGIMGYCLYLGQDANGDPVTSKGLLGNSAFSTNGSCPFAVQNAQVDLTTTGLLATALATSDQPYYLNIKAIDNAKNIYNGAPASFNFRYDNSLPTNPTFVTAPSQFVASKDVTLTWPTTGGDAPSDANSGIKGLQYRIGNNGTWYGDAHSGAQDINDLLVNDGSYTTIDPTDYDNLVEGNNVFYFRTWDNAGNVSSVYTTSVLKLNTTSPSSPQNVTASPSTNTTNSFAFSWAAPSAFQGTAGNLTYCYTVNTLPSANTCTYTLAGVTSLPAGAYATQPGANTFYVVAKDEAGNINYATTASDTFTANTAAPGVPLDLDIADVSTKATSTWRLALSWNAPTNAGAGVSNYRVYRSNDNTSFSEVATTAGTSYVDGNLNTQKYYYKLKACDSANNCGAYSSVVNKLPTGKFTTAATITAQPRVINISTKKATVRWSTDRNSNSRISLGTKTGEYAPFQVASEQQVTDHVVDLTNLSAGTTYFAKASWTDEDGNTGLSSEFSFKTQDAPSTQEVKALSIGLSSAQIQFTSVSAAKVVIQYGKSDGFGGVKEVATSLSRSTYTLDLAGLDDGTKYLYRLNTYDADGNEYVGSTVLNFTTPARPRISNLRFQPVAGEPTSTQEVSWTTNVPASSLIRFASDKSPSKELSDSTLTTDHKLVAQNLLDDTTYNLVAESRDVGGNLAVSDSQVLKTALDTRPPKISNLKVETTIRGNGAEARGQIVVSWKTDEPATSQVAYGQGSGLKNFNSRTSEDNSLSLEHIVIVSDLSTSRVYTVQPVSSDKSDNSTSGNTKSAIIGRASDSVISIVINALKGIFGF